MSVMPVNANVEYRVFQIRVIHRFHWLMSLWTAFLVYNYSRVLPWTIAESGFIYDFVVTKMMVGCMMVDNYVE